jgi:hypothetical protein
LKKVRVREINLTKAMKNILEFQLEHYVGAQQYYPYQIDNQVLFLTDGCQYVADQAQAYWLFELILSYQPDKRLREEPVQVWTLTKQHEGDWLITCADGYDTVLLTHWLEDCDFPLRTIELYLIDSECMLASEYEKPLLPFPSHASFIDQ